MADQIAGRRNQIGMTQEELAKKSGISRAIISGLESGRIEVTTTQTLLRIARALECSVSDIFLTEKFNQLNEPTHATHVCETEHTRV